MKKSLIYIFLISLLVVLAESGALAIETEEEFRSRQRSRSSSEQTEELKIKFDIETDDEDSTELEIDGQQLIEVETPVDPISFPNFPDKPASPFDNEPTPTPISSPKTTSTEQHNTQENGNTTTTVDHVVSKTESDDGKVETSVSHKTVIQTRKDEIINEFNKTNQPEVSPAPSPAPESTPLTIDLSEQRPIEIHEDVVKSRWTDLPSRINQAMVDLFNRIF